MSAPPPPPMPIEYEYKNNVRVFVSSTYEDLKDYREAVFRAIHSMFGYSDDMLFWSADERDPLTASTDRVKQCDMVILLIAHRYGTIPSDEKYSITESEYRTAKESNIPVFAFLVDENMPWPASFIETEKREELKNFKDLINADVTRKTFRSKDELFALVTQALHNYIERHRESLPGQKQFRGTLLTKSHSELLSEPDIVLKIGESEDGLPLLLGIRRSKDLNPHINALAELITPSPSDQSIELLNNFQDSLKKFAAKTWANHQIFPVEMKNGEIEDMYVTENNLSQLMSSMLSRILKATQEGGEQVNLTNKSTSKRHTKSRLYGLDEEEAGTDIGFGGHDEDSQPKHHIESAGGLNRFLGISLKSGLTYSVGKSSDKWKEWHPFLFESIVDNFPNCKFIISSDNEVYYSSYLKSLEEFCLDKIDNDGSYHGTVQFSISRQSIGHLIASIARVVQYFHSKGEIHGDIKPGNILLTKNDPVLIDSFNLKPGDLAPGWTPKWSAPEQALREPVTYAADIFPLGMMLANLLGGKVVGEVRKFKVPNAHGKEKEFDIFYNPSVFIRNMAEVFISGNIKWITLIKSCLQSVASNRPESVEQFSKELLELLDNHPLKGEVIFDLPYAEIVAATLLDGSKKVARLIAD